MPSMSVENYLKNIYELEASEKTVTTTLLAAKLKISPASVTDMVKKLSKKRVSRHVQSFVRHATEKRFFRKLLYHVSNGCGEILSFAEAGWW